MKARILAAIAAVALVPSLALAQGAGAAGQAVDQKFQGPVNPQRPFNTGDVISWNGVAWIASAGPSSGAVPTSRTIYTTSPLTIDGGSSADLSANRTLAIAPSPTNSWVLATVAGVVSWVNPSSVVPAPTLQSVCVAGRTYDGTSGAVRLYNASTGSTNALTLNDESAAGVGLKYVSNSGESGGVCAEVWNGDTSARASIFALYAKATDGFEVPNGQSLLNASLNLNSASTIVWRNATDVFSGSNDIRERRTSAKTLTFDDASGGNMTLAVIGAQTITRTSADTTSCLTISKSPSSANSGNGIDVTLGANATGNGVLVSGTIYSATPGTSQNTGLAVSGGSYFAPVFVYGLASNSSGLTQTLHLNDTKALAQGNGAGICLGGIIDGTTNAQNLAGIQAYKANATSSNVAGDLAFFTRAAASGTLSEAGRFTNQSAFQIAASTGSTVGAAGASALRSNAGTLEVSNNGGAWTAVATGSSGWTDSGTIVATTTATDGVQIGASAPGSSEILQVTGDATRHSISFDAGAGGTVLLSVGGTTSLSAALSSVTIGPVIGSYNSVATAGWGVPAIYGAAEITGQSGAATIVTYTVGAADADVEVSGTLNVTAASSISANVEVLYTDVANNAGQIQFPLMKNGGTAGTFLANGLATTTGDYCTATLHLRVKASTQITIRVPASGTFVGVTYSASGAIRQLR